MFKFELKEAYKFIKKIKINWRYLYDTYMYFKVWESDLRSGKGWYKYILLKMGKVLLV